MIVPKELQRRVARICWSTGSIPAATLIKLGNRFEALLCAPRNALTFPLALSFTSSTSSAAAAAVLLPLPLAVAGSAEAAALLPNACTRQDAKFGKICQSETATQHRHHTTAASETDTNSTEHGVPLE